MFAKCSDCVAIGNKRISYYVHSLGFNHCLLSEENKIRPFKATTKEISTYRIRNNSYWDKILISAKLWLICWHLCLLLFHPAAPLRPRAKGQDLQGCSGQWSCSREWQEPGKGFSASAPKSVTCKGTTPVLLSVMFLWSLFVFLPGPTPVNTIGHGTYRTDALRWLTWGRGVWHRQLCLRETGRKVLPEVISERTGKGFSDVELSYWTRSLCMLWRDFYSDFTTRASGDSQYYIDTITDTAESCCCWGLCTWLRHELQLTSDTLIRVQSLQFKERERNVKKIVLCMIIWACSIHCCKRRSRGWAYERKEKNLSLM